jgi:crotonobetainyl-CoA:carnitine CoA-transferase CaiB-like acyl-CoA transferase
MFTPMEYPGAFDSIPLCLSTIKMSETPVQLYRRPPTIGEHTDEIMSELGFSNPEISAYRRDRII